MSIRQIVRTLHLVGTQHPLPPKRRQPGLLQLIKREPQRISLREYQQGMSGDQFRLNLPGQLSKQALGAISANCDPEPLPHDDADSTEPRIGSADQQIEQGRGDTAAMLLDVLDVAAGSKKNGPISSTL
jgi:hypothetical protein